MVEPFTRELGERPSDVSLRLVMMGTGSFALPVFLRLCHSPHNVVGLFTKPDRRGRGHHRHRNPLKEAARERNVSVFQPESINSPEGLTDLQELQPDLAVVAAYGQILSPDVIETPKYGCINVHASLLPKYRGAAPVHHAILNGETATGVTIFQIVPKLDAGPILGTVETTIGPKETTGQLEQRLAVLAVPLTLQVVDQIEQGTVEHRPQNPEAATRAPSLNKASGRIDWAQSAQRIANHIRAMQPWPTAFTFLHRAEDGPLRIILSEAEARDELPDGAAGLPDAPPGTVASADKHSVIVHTGSGYLDILRLRPEGKRDMTIIEFQQGHALQQGDRFSGSGQR